MTVWHPRKNDKGQCVEIKYPNKPTPLTAWADSDAIATVVPDGPMPATVCGIPIRSSSDAPKGAAEWMALAVMTQFAEPHFELMGHTTKAAAGAVIVEADHRVWVVSPTNRFGGYVNTFPKGKIEPGMTASLRANAMKEVFEEAGLQIELTGFLVDAERSTSTTRYYLARRIGGNPADMSWESQAVHLVPPRQLAAVVFDKNDAPVIAALQAKLGSYP
jgi:8-oxo-dGTP pyrophosphatase MutT (NUDIX family)